MRLQFSRIILITALLVCLFSIITTSPAFALPVSNGVVAEYTFTTDIDGLTIVQDTSGNDNDLTGTANVVNTNATTGAKYRTYINKYSTGSVTGLNNRSGAIEIWYRTNNTVSSAKDLWGLNITTPEGAITTIRLEQQVNTTSGKQRYSLYLPNSNPNTTVGTETHIYPTGELDDIVVTWVENEYHTKQVCLYVNNQLMGTGFIAAGYDMPSTGVVFNLGCADPATRLMSYADIYTVRLYNKTPSYLVPINYDAGRWMDTGAYYADLSKDNFNVSKQSANQVISIELDRPATGTVIVNYVTTEGTATSPENYTLNSGTVAFNTGDSIKTIPVTLPDNGALEIYPKKTFNVQITSVTGTSVNKGVINISTVSIGNTGGIVFSVDDRDYTNDTAYIVPIMNDHGARGTFFVSVYTNTSEPANKATLVKAIEDAGNEIGIHTIDHVRASTYLVDHTVQEYIDSQCTPEEQFIVADGITEPVGYAFPYGDKGSAELRSRLLDYYVYTRDATPETDLFDGRYDATDKLYYKFDNNRLPAAAALGASSDYGDGSADIQLAYDAVDKAIEDGYVIGFMTHSVNPTGYNGVTDTYFDDLLTYVETKGGDFYTYESLYSFDLYPKANFTVSTINPIVGTEITCHDYSTNATSYSYNFGDWNTPDGGTSTDANPTYTYQHPGTYTVTLTAINDAGESTATITIQVNPAPIVDSGSPFDISGELIVFGTLGTIVFAVLLTILGAYAYMEINKIAGASTKRGYKNTANDVGGVIAVVIMGIITLIIGFAIAGMFYVAFFGG
jgi:peptidoglycan/xylan/chitin deacetylase (PgdA/CDA1 family)